MHKLPEAGSFFDRIDHAAAAKNAGLDMRPRTVIIFWQPKSGHAPNDQERNTGNRSADKGAGLAGRSGQGLAYLQYERIQCEVCVATPRTCRLGRRIESP